MQQTIRQTIKNKLQEMLEGESGYYPLGAEHDSSAPWNETDDFVDVNSYKFDPITSMFTMYLSNGTASEIEGNDVLERFWKKNPGSYQAHESMFGDNDQTFDNNAIEYEERKSPKIFSSILYDIADYRGLLSNSD